MGQAENLEKTMIKKANPSLGELVQNVNELSEGNWNKLRKAIDAQEKIFGKAMKDLQDMRDKIDKLEGK